jgi:branched-chain amino acid transport system permease protein
MDYVLHLLIYLQIYALLALGLNLVVGYGGLLTLAHAAFYAVGAYAYAVLSIAWGWPFAPAALGAIAITTLLSLAASLPAWRLKGDFFVLASLSLQVLVMSLIYNWSDASSSLGTWRNLTNGPFGIADIPRPLGAAPSDTLAYAVIVSAVFAVGLMIAIQLAASPWRRVVVGMRENELAVQGLGKNTRLLKVQALALSAAYAGAAGVLYAGYVGYIDASAASIEESILMLSMVLLGGVGNLRGPLVGAAVLILLPEALRLVSLPDAQAANMRLAIYGLVLIVLMRLRPQGLAGAYKIK